MDLPLRWYRPHPKRELHPVPAPAPRLAQVTLAPQVTFPTSKKIDSYTATLSLGTRSRWHADLCCRICVVGCVNTPLGTIGLAAALQPLHPR